MTFTREMAALNFGGPADYQVVVEGIVSEEWSKRLGMAIVELVHESGASRTILRGMLQDQSALRGLIETLYALHLPILEVKQINSSSDNGKAKSQD